MERQSADGFNLDYKRILSRALTYWYIVVISLCVSLVVAFLNNRYSTRLYPVTASVIVKEADDDISGAELIYNTTLLNFKRNYLNETYILKSYPLVQRVIEDLNFDIVFLREGNILTTEAYEVLPIEAIPLRDSTLRNCNFYFSVLNQREYQLKTSQEQAGDIFRFGDTISYAGFRGVFGIKNPSGLEAIRNEPLIFTYTSSLTLASRYIRDLNVSWAEEGAGVLNLSIIGSNPKKEKDFLTGLITTYQANDLDNKNQTASRTVDFISEQLEGISDSLRQVERQLQRFKDKNVVTDLTEEALRLHEKIESVEAQKAGLIISKNYYKYLIDYIQRNENLDQIILPTSVGIADPILSGLVSKMTEIQMEIKMLRKANNPLVQDAVKSIVEIKKDIVESVRNQESTDLIKLDYLNKQIKGLEKQLGYLPIAERDLVAIRRNYSLMENLYIFLLQKKSEAAITKASNTSDITLVNPPIAGGPIAPKTATNYAVAFAIGLLLPLLIFGLQEMLDNRIQSREDIEKFTTIPFIGGVGHKKGNDNLAVFNQPKSLIAESFRALRSNLHYFIGQKDKAVFLITSSISGEGKTFTSINLASVLALSGKRVLIVGADMRKPKLFNDFNLNNTTGLSTYLAGMASFKEILQKTTFENLDLITGGPVPPNPSELLLTPRMNSFITEAKVLYDYVIIDTPPLAIVTDAFVLSSYADHTLFLVRQNYTPRNLLRTVQDFYTTSKLMNISIVLNDIYRSGPGYGYGYSGYAYGYGYLQVNNGNGYYSE